MENDSKLIKDTSLVNDHHLQGRDQAAYNCLEAAFIGDQLGEKHLAAQISPPRAETKKKITGASRWAPSSLYEK